MTGMAQVLLLELMEKLFLYVTVEMYYVLVHVI